MKSNIFKTTVSCIAALTLLSFRSSTIAVKYSAFFQASNIKIYDKKYLLFNYYHAKAFLLKEESQKLNPFYGQLSGNVSFNDLKLAYNNHAKGYFDTIIRKDQNIKWNVDDSDKLPKFQYSSMNLYPVFDEAPNNMPDQLNVAEDLVINLQSATNFDEIEFMIEDTQFHLSMPWYRRELAIDNVVIPKNALADLIGPNLVIRLVLIKSETAAIEGKNFKFENRLELLKKVELKKAIR